jgi:hypothetical protein
VDVKGQGDVSHSIKLSFGNGAVTYITPFRARQLRKKKEAYIFSKLPFELRMRNQIQAWSGRSDGKFVMSGAVLMRKLPRLGVGSTQRRAKNEVE